MARMVPSTPSPTVASGCSHRVGLCTLFSATSRSTVEGYRFMELVWMTASAALRAATRPHPEMLEPSSAMFQFPVAWLEKAPRTPNTRTASMIPTEGARKYDALVPPVFADGTANREVVDSL